MPTPRLTTSASRPSSQRETHKPQSPQKGDPTEEDRGEGGQRAPEAHPDQQSGNKNAHPENKPEKQEERGRGGARHTAGTVRPKERRYSAGTRHHAKETRRREDDAPHPPPLALPPEQQVERSAEVLFPTGRADRRRTKKKTSTERPGQTAPQGANSTRRHSTHSAAGTRPRTKDEPESGERDQGKEGTKRRETRPRPKQPATGAEQRTPRTTTAWRNEGTEATRGPTQGKPRDRTPPRAPPTARSGGERRNSIRR